MAIHELYTKLCPVCKESFTCVSAAGKYCSEKCRGKAYRRRKQLARDGMIRNVPKLYDQALRAIQLNCERAFKAIETMSLCDCNSFSIKSAIYAAFVSFEALMPWESEDYTALLRADLNCRKQYEIFKYVPFEEASR